MHMGGTEELAEQEKQPPDDGAEPLMLLAQLEGAHDHAGWSNLLVCLTLKERAVKQRVGGARWMVSQSSRPRQRAAFLPSGGFRHPVDIGSSRRAPAS